MDARAANGGMDKWNVYYRSSTNGGSSWTAEVDLSTYVAGSTLLADQLSPPERAKTQGCNDFLLNLASAASQIGSGVVYASGGFGVMGLAAAAAAVVPLALAIWWQVAGSRKR